MIDPLSLRCRVHLQMARPGANLEQETEAATEYLEELQWPFSNWLEHELPVTLDDLAFVIIDEDTARVFHERFHYIGSFRPGQHFALKHRRTRRIACMGSIAPFDLNHLNDKIEPFLGTTMVLSRFFAFAWAPRYVFSHFWGKLRHYLIKEHGTELVFSWINPNLGFNASSHKGAQFVVFGYEEGTRYMYLDGQYQTMRFFVQNHGTSDTDKLKEKLGLRFEVSTTALQPLIILANPLSKRAQKVIPATPYLFQRPTL